MITTDFVNGAPNWLDLSTPDLDGSIAFYGGVFGWQFRAGGPETGGYGMFRLEDKTVAGAMTVTADQGTPGWTVYFRSTDAESVAKAAEQAGGTVFLQPMDVLDQGRMAILADPGGAAFGIWQPGEHKGFGHVTQDGGLNWVELYAPDVSAAKAFYGSVFGWSTFDVEFPGGSYTTVNPAGADEDAMFGGIVPLDVDPAEAQAGAHWTPYIHVPDVDAAADAARRLGGTVRTAPVDLPGVGRIAKLSDQFGAGFAVIKGNPDQQ
ncbi:VOC family protein [Streptomyces kunmingensis]|uniref:VOC family protein n=1 Tax=Streptomyces kunmingensis TaxID=68225 RepID=A0ABU6CSZ0_9ACTN|nr:VOC family protein [Streptomyces kunmingensis]MEB3967096.1 VOC family protein [Streptomyces kunmingensis]